MKARSGPLWSDHVLEELRRNLIKAGAKREAVEHRLGQMATYFPDARVTGYEQLIGSMTNHPKDRHVLAAAVAGRADVARGALNSPASAAPCCRPRSPRPTAEQAALLERVVGPVLEPLAVVAVIRLLGAVLTAAIAPLPGRPATVPFPGPV
jgi:hypothetical protein